ncbi:SRPBCC domain-containing protein [Kitasatospora sp. NPDC002551]|uniref:SRPBCC domain-containing protein n=1 Tax=Kitasatospora sp. NPDC002551 TaxID=3154539 RepID=UPI003323D7A3
MEHEVVVPMPAGQVRQALQDPALLARSVPGLSTEPAAVGSRGAEEIGGRLKLRIGTSTITYKGVLSLIEGREGVLTAFAEGQEARGSGEATVTVRISVAEGAEGTAVVRFTGDLSATGRLTEFDGETLDAAGRRLLDRFTAALTSQGDQAEADEDEAGGEDGTGAEDAGEAGQDAAAEENTAGEGTVVFLENRQEDREDEPGDDLDDDLSDLIAFSDADAERFGLPLGNADADADDVEEPAGAEETAAAEEEVSAELPAELPFGYEQEPALGGPVRRSIVGRSAEEVDHAPPRGPYAPALPARSARARAASRWGGDAGGIVVPGVGGRSTVPWMIGGGVALLGGAVVLVRALRRR